MESQPLHPAPAEQPPVNEVNPDAEFRFALRAGGPDDVRFVSESWRRHYSDSNWTRCPGGKDEYIATQKAVIAQALATSEVLIAYPDMEEHREPKQILGWLCFRHPRVLHYLFVKPYYRRKGIAAALLLAAMESRLGGAVFLTHGWRQPHGRGEAIDHIVARAAAWHTHIEYNPALIFGGTT